MIRCVSIYLDAISHNFSGRTGDRSSWGCDALWVQEVCLELSKGLLDAPSLSGSRSHSDSLFFFCVSSFSLLGFSLKCWTVGKIIFKNCLLLNSFLPLFFWYTAVRCADVRRRVSKIKIKVTSCLRGSSSSLFVDSNFPA